MLWSRRIPSLASVVVAGKGEGGCFVAVVHGFKCIAAALAGELQAIADGVRASECMGCTRNVRSVAGACQMASEAATVADKGS